MTPQRWKGAGVLFMVVAALLVVAAVVSVLLVGAVRGPVSFQQYEAIPVGLLNTNTAVLRGVVLGAFAGVAFFLGLACFLWSGLAEANQQRAEILTELAALRADRAARLTTRSVADPEDPGKV